MGLREDKKAEMRRRLYESATAMYRERGFAETRVRDVIDDVGVSEATFFNYFPTKEAVLRDSSLETKRFYGAYLSNLANRADEAAADRLRELTKVIASVFAKDRAFMGTVLNNTDLFFGSEDDGKQLDLDNYELMATIIRQGQKAGELDKKVDAKQLAEMITATYLMTIMNWVNEWWGPSKDKLETRAVNAVNVILRGAAA